MEPEGVLNVIFGVFGIVVLLAAVALVIDRLIQPIRKRKQREQLEADAVEPRSHWLAEVQQAGTSVEALAKIRSPLKSWENVETLAAVSQINAAKQQLTVQNEQKERTAVSEFYDQLRLVTDVRQRRKLLKRAPGATWRYSDNDVTIDELLRQSTKQYAVLLLEESRAGSAKSFLKLEEMTAYRRDEYYDHVGKMFKFPKDWDSMLVRFCKNPSVDQFHNQPTYEPQEILLLATEALRTGSFVKAKLVLAYSMESEIIWVGNTRTKQWPYRDAVGHSLLAQLAALVDNEHVAQGLFGASPATTIND